MKIVRRFQLWRVQGHWNNGRWVSAHFRKKTIEIPIPDNWITQPPSDK